VTCRASSLSHLSYRFSLLIAPPSRRSDTNHRHHLPCSFRKKNDIASGTTSVRVSGHAALVFCPRCRQAGASSGHRASRVRVSGTRGTGTGGHSSRQRLPTRGRAQCINLTITRQCRRGGHSAATASRTTTRAAARGGWGAVGTRDTGYSLRKCDRRLARVCQGLPSASD
jgi:hypothetical protein